VSCCLSRQNVAAIQTSVDSQHFGMGENDTRKVRDELIPTKSFEISEGNARVVVK